MTSTKLRDLADRVNSLLVAWGEQEDREDQVKIVEELRELAAISELGVASIRTNEDWQEAKTRLFSSTALAPPSGEGVVSGLDDATLLRSLAEDVDDMAPEIRTQLRLIADGINTGKLRCRRCGEHADVRISTATIPTTPQSAPVDGELARIGELIRTQNNRITDQPMFIVQQKREYVAHPDYDHDLIAWFDGDGEANEEEAAALEAQYKDTHREPAGWTRAPVGYYWEFVTACFTEQGCKDYIARDGHNLREPRIYASGSYRNEEWRTVRNYLAGLTTPPPASQERGGDIDLAIAVMNAADAYERTMQNYHDGKDRQILRGQLKLLRDFCGPIIEASNAEAIG